MAENFPNLVKYLNLQIWKVDQTPNKIRLQTSMSRNIIIKLLKTKAKSSGKQPETKHYE